MEAERKRTWKHERCTLDKNVFISFRRRTEKERVARREPDFRPEDTTRHCRDWSRGDRGFPAIDKDPRSIRLEGGRVSSFYSRWKSTRERESVSQPLGGNSGANSVAAPAFESPMGNPRLPTLAAAVPAPTTVKATLLPVVPPLPTSVYLSVITLRACYRSFCTSYAAKRIRHDGLVKAEIVLLLLLLFWASRDTLYIYPVLSLTPFARTLSLFLS